MKTAIITVCVGDDYEKISKLTHPTIKAYANRIGAEFICITDRKMINASISYERLRVVQIFEDYNLDRAIYLDTDLIVSDNCPNLFEVVQDGYLGVYNEGEFFEKISAMNLGCEQFKTTIIEPNKWGTRYYNAGVMVFDREHLPIFEVPEVCHDNYYEQTWLNIQINRKLQWDRIKNIGYKFNRMAHMEGIDTDTRFDSYIIHYAGHGYVPTFVNIQSLETQIKNDIEIWGKHGS